MLKTTLKRLARKIPIGARPLFFPTRAVPLHAMTGGMGHMMETSPSYDWHGLKRGKSEFVLFQYTLSGRGCLRVGRSEFSVTPGTAMLLHVPADNQYWLPDETDASWEFFYLCLHGLEVMRLWPRVEQAHGPLAEISPDAEPVRMGAEFVTAALEGRVASAFEASAWTYRWLMSMLSLAPTCQSPAPRVTALEQARRFAEEHFAESPGPGVSDLARAAGMSRYHFTRLFTAQFGMPPGEWLLACRIREAARLLRGTEWPLKEIARRCGFNDPGYFGRVFHEKTGQPPGSFRRSGV